MYVHSEAGSKHSRDGLALRIAARVTYLMLLLLVLVLLLGYSVLPHGCKVLTSKVRTCLLAYLLDAVYNYIRRIYIGTSYYLFPVANR